MLSDYASLLNVIHITRMDVMYMKWMKGEYRKIGWNEAISIRNGEVLDFVNKVKGL